MSDCREEIEGSGETTLTIVREGWRDRLREVWVHLRVAWAIIRYGAVRITFPEATYTVCRPEHHWVRGLMWTGRRCKHCGKEQVCRDDEWRDV